MFLVVCTQRATAMLRAQSVVSPPNIVANLAEVSVIQQRFGHENQQPDDAINPRSSEIS
jgi:hypothetical protein